MHEQIYTNTQKQSRKYLNNYMTYKILTHLHLKYREPGDWIIAYI